MRGEKQKMIILREKWRQVSACLEPIVCRVLRLPAIRSGRSIPGPFETSSFRTFFPRLSRTGASLHATRFETGTRRTAAGAPGIGRFLLDNRVFSGRIRTCPKGDIY